MGLIPAANAELVLPVRLGRGEFIMLIKYNFLRKSRGQSLSEYAILLAVVAAAVGSMQLLVKGRFNAML